MEVRHTSGLDAQVNDGMKRIDRGEEEAGLLPEQELKRIKLRRFLNILASDESMKEAGGQSLPELIQYTGYGLHLKQEAGDGGRACSSGGRRSAIDLAELLTLALHKQGVKKSFEDLMNHMLQGGSLSNFSD